MLSSSVPESSLATVSGALFVVIVSLVLKRVINNLYFHPLAGFPGPWYAASTSLTLAVVSYWRVEVQWLMSLTEKYGTERPIRISPTMLLFPKAEHMKKIYWEPSLNTKAQLYGSGALGPPSLFTTMDGEEHRQLRKALGGSQWTIGSLKNKWESRLDELIVLFTEKMNELASAGEEVVLCDKVAQFAADFLTQIAFSDSWGFVRNGRDERAFLRSFRKGLDYFGPAGRWHWFRRHILKSPMLAPYFLPSTSDTTGMGYLAFQADRQITEREREMQREGEGWGMEEPDLLQYCLDARLPDGSPLSPAQKRGHVTLLIQAGADTTGTAMGCTLRLLLTHPAALARARAELADAAATAGKLRRPVLRYAEAREHLPFFAACVREALRLQPPATSLFARVVPPTAGAGAGGGATVMIGETPVPPGTEVTSVAYVVQRDPEVFGPDPLAFRPERWLLRGDAAREAEMDAAIFAFGMGPRVCLGKDVAYLELFKLLPEIIRNFDIELLDPGQYVVASGVAYNENLRVKLGQRPQT
ncbi:cytochrome P450 [Xylariaceae sp. FL0804]|nr:cytochrome P450 [Xylariaceae sp. FL0804]